ncbi:alanyl-tRNA editing protein [Cytobacillus depressus]|uniref:Alanine--tRNA ligase n=1 Tax=Cytobacillus depressus TaxID=1602942 RepID=A0A6L3UZJ8_9BACI|nr:DHHA1 domain-containing protein [Cytobacillus depressus]KAB2329944.1 alanyl-tRNA editing protein [Cytobacillus depressus]
MESKLYYEDPYLKSFTAHLLKQEKDEQGKWYAVLDKTAFYPTGGGQPNDTGTLNDIKVIDVEEIDGEIRHYVEKELPETLGNIAGQIDWDRRFDHMQQHAGQHILTAAFVELFSFPTVSFHLGKETSTIDLDISELTDEQALEAEKLANQIILEGRPIETKWVTESELSGYQLRKALSVTENIRLVIIPDFDYNGCGGTHPKSTAEVGPIKILDWERQKSKIRVQFVCGGRVLTQLHQKQKVIKDLTELLNAPEQGLPPAAKKLIDLGKERDKTLEFLRESLLSYEAKELLQRAEKLENGKMICEVFQDRSIQELQKLARSITAFSDEVLVFLVNETKDKLQFVCARGSKSSISMKQVSSALLSAINGKGGGNDHFAQGGGEKLITGEQLLQHAREKALQEIK